MKTKNKGKIEYVEEFRKITALQKLPTLKQGFGDLFFENKAENNKFLRLKDEPFLNELQLNTRLYQLCENDYVHEYISDAEGICKKQIETSILELNDQIASYKQWAKSLTDYVEEGKYVYKFRSHKASPPIALAKEMTTFDPLAMQLAYDPVNKKNKNTKNKQTQGQVDNVSLTNLPTRKKRFDFGQITDYLITDDFKMQDLEGNIDLAKREIENFRHFKTIEQINQIQELKADYEKFEYNALDISSDYTDRKSRSNQSEIINNFGIKNPNNSSMVEEDNVREVKKKSQISLPDILRPSKNHYQKFKHLSIMKNVLDSNINYFRNLGPPSRHPEDFIRALIIEENEKNILHEEENPLTRQKIDTCLLHFLEPNELKVNKNTLNFYDIENISMSRIVNSNAHMCIRSEKVTRLQYDKLVKKMDKLYKMQHEDGKTRVNQAVSTEEFEQESGNRKTKNDGSQKLSLNKIVEEINAIRKQVFNLRNADEQDKPYKFINERLVYDEMSRKMFSLLEELYKRVCEQLPFSYSILEIGLHVDEVNGLAESQYEKKKLIWFIMTVLEEIEKSKSLQKNISYLQNKNKKDDDPRVIKYKGDKIVAKDKMGAKNLYYNNPAAVTTARERSISTNGHHQKFSPSKICYVPNKTPLKNNINNLTPNKALSKSPLKSNTPTQQKKPYNNNFTPTKDKSTTNLNNNGSTTKRNFKF